MTEGRNPDWEDALRYRALQWAARKVPVTFGHKSWANENKETTDKLIDSVCDRFLTDYLAELKNK